MKVLEMLFLARLNKQMHTFQDALQFAYRNGLEVEDGICFFSKPATESPFSSGSTMRMIFFFVCLFFISQVL